MLGICFDARKDKTLINELKNSRYHRKIVTEEHISIIGEPNSNTGKGICNSIISYLKMNQGYIQEILCIGCDGTATNTGWNTGIIRSFEVALGRPLQWIICLLHANELPFRHLFIALDGSTSGPKGYSGPIGAALINCDKNALTSPVTGNLPTLDENIVQQLSTEQKYLFEICSAIQGGSCPIEVASRGKCRILYG